MKLINNAVAAANAATLAQALLVGSAQGLDLDALVEVMAAGSGASTMLTLKAGPMRDHDYTTLFKTEHMLKDIRLCLEEAQDANVPFPAAAAAATRCRRRSPEGTVRPGALRSVTSHGSSRGSRDRAELTFQVARRTVVEATQRARLA